MKRLFGPAMNRLLGFGALALSACQGASPDYAPPTVAFAQSWSAGDALARSGHVDADSAWVAFGDPLLDRLEAQARAASPSVALALGRVREARALLAASAGAELPTLEANTSVLRRRRSEEAFSQAPFTSERIDDLLDVGFDASYELDLFGRVARSVEAASADLEAARADLAAVHVTLAGDVARTYIELRRAQAELELGGAENALLEDALALARERTEAGLGSELELARAEALHADAASALPALEVAVRARANALSVLVGSAPGSLAAELAIPSAVPATAEFLELGLPAEVLARRPDLVSAERRLAAATARVGVARADLYPSVTLSGSFGWLATTPGDLFQGSSQAWSLGPGIRWPLFDRAALRARADAEEARVDGAHASWRASVLTAMCEVEDALASHAAHRQRSQELARALAAGERAVALAGELYASGITDLRAVIEARRTRLALERRVVANRADLALAFVALAKALGGGVPTEAAAD